MNDPTFFIDRSVGLHAVADVFRTAGHAVVLMRDHYPDGRDQEVGDDEWIAEVAARGWVAITKDAAIVRAHSGALAASTLRAFTFVNANMTGQQMAERVQALLPGILERSAEPGPFVDGLYAAGLGPKWPKPAT